MGFLCGTVDLQVWVLEWQMCCALHNFLLEIDGLSEPWDGESGLHDFDEETDNIPFAI